MLKNRVFNAGIMPTIKAISAENRGAFIDSLGVEQHAEILRTYMVSSFINEPDMLDLERSIDGGGGVT